MNPLSSENAASQGGGQPVEAGAAARRFRAERDEVGGIGAVAQPGGAGRGEPDGAPRAGALAAMQPAPAIGHGRLAAGVAGAGAGAAARSGGEIAGGVAVAQAAST
jgi:hypothetical protein